MAMQQSLKAAGVRAAVSGGVAAGVSGFVLGESGSVSAMGMSVPAPVAVGLCSAGGTILADVAHQFILPTLPHNERYMNMESAALGIAASGGATALAAYMLGGQGYLEAFLVGAGSFISADYVTSKLVDTNSQYSII